MQGFVVLETARSHLHLTLHARPNAVYLAMFPPPDLTVFNAIKKLSDIALAIGPRIGACWQRAGTRFVFDGVSPAEVDLYICWYKALPKQDVRDFEWSFR